MAISHLVMTIGVGISQKKNIKKFDLVTILWFDPYTSITAKRNEDERKKIYGYLQII